jgi:hypothetical protein
MSAQHAHQQVLLWDGGSAVQLHDALPPAVPSQAPRSSVASVSSTARPAVLAESVLDGVRAKMQGLRAALADREAALQQLDQVR